MSEEKKVLSEAEKKQVKDNATRILGYIRDIPAVPIEITLSGKGNKGRLEVTYFLKILEQLREVKYLDKKVDDRAQTIKAEILRKQRPYKPEITGKPLIDTYEIPGGMILEVLDDEEGGLSVRLRENLGKKGKSNLEKLINILRTWTHIKSVDMEDITGRDGGKIGSKAILEIIGLKQSTSLEKILLKQIKLYENTQKSLFKMMADVEKQRRLDPKELLDEIQFYTNLEGVNFNELKERIELAYFLREIYGLVEAETGVTMDEIRSNRKPRKVAENRHALMYLCHYRFPYVSSTTWGKVFSKYGEKAKNHATVLLALDMFKSVGIAPEKYPDKRYVTRTLYHDVQEKRLEFLKEKPRKNQPKKLTREWVFGSAKNSEK